MNIILFYVIALVLLRAGYECGSNHIDFFP
jgi:hypothetical protein